MISQITAPLVTVPSLHHFGLSDDYIPGDVVARIRGVVMANPDCEFHTYEGANHAFDNADFPMFHQQASALAWEPSGCPLSKKARLNHCPSQAGPSSAAVRSLRPMSRSFRKTVTGST